MMHKIDLVFRDYTRSKCPAMSRAIALNIAHKTLMIEGFKSSETIELSVILVGTKRIQNLNNKWRKKDFPTDVLSFPLSGHRTKGYTSITLGDIFISPMVVRTKAVKAGMSERAYITWTLVHGLLHLLGYDHERSPIAAKKMEAMEKKILKKLVSSK